MAEILLNFFDNIILATAVEEVVPAVGFFKDRYFPTGAGDIFKADKVIGVAGLLTITICCGRICGMTQKAERLQ